jgi:hypothetical protein
VGGADVVCGSSVSPAAVVTNIASAVGEGVAEVMGLAQAANSKPQAASRKQLLNRAGAKKE